MARVVWLVLTCSHGNKSLKKRCNPNLIIHVIRKKCQKTTGRQLRHGLKGFNMLAGPLVRSLLWVHQLHSVRVFRGKGWTLMFSAGPQLSWGLSVWCTAPGSSLVLHGKKPFSYSGQYPCALICSLFYCLPFCYLFVLLSIKWTRSMFYQVICSLNEVDCELYSP